MGGCARMQPQFIIANHRHIRHLGHESPKFRTLWETSLVLALRLSLQRWCCSQRAMRSPGSQPPSRWIKKLVSLTTWSRAAMARVICKGRGGCGERRY